MCNLQLTIPFLGRPDSFTARNRAIPEINQGWLIKKALQFVANDIWMLSEGDKSMQREKEKKKSGLEHMQEN